MTAIAEKKNWSSIDKIGSYGGYPHYNKISSVKEVIYLTTDKGTVTTTNLLLKQVEGFINEVVNSAEISMVKLKKFFKDVNKNKKSIDTALEAISTIFYNGHATNKDVIIDDPNMNKFMENLSKINKILDYLSDYIKLLIDVSDEKKTKKKQYNSSELIELL